MNISISSEIINKYPSLLFGFSKVDNIQGYSSDEEKNRAEKRIVSKVLEKFPNNEKLENNYLNDLYIDFYKSMGFKPKKVSTPIRQAARIIENKTYRSIYKTIDVCMEIEYIHLVSFQVYDFNKIKGNLKYTISNGIEVIKNFHNEDSVCKKGELILVDDECPLHSVYYGNNKDKSIDFATKTVLIRIMGVPGIQKVDFEIAIKEFESLIPANFEIISKNNFFRGLNIL